MIVESNTFWGLISMRAEVTPDSLLMVDSGGRRLTFLALRDEAEAVAAALADRGVGAGSIVSWQLPNRVEAVVLSAALARLGAIQNPVVSIAREREVGFGVRQLGTDMLVTTSRRRGFDFAAMAENIRSTVPELDVLVVEEELPRGDRSNLRDAPRDDLSPAEQPVRWVLYTSGTTSDPKGARHTDASLIASGRNIAGRLRMTADDRNAIVFPFAHIGGLSFLLGDLITGASSILVERFDAEAVILLSREGVTLAGSGTPFNLAYLKVQEDCPDRPIFPRVRAFPGGGATRPAVLHRRMKDVFGGAGIISGYGLTETGSLAMADVDDPDELLAGTEGRAYPNTDLRIVKADGTVAGTGEVGEIRARGPQLMRGYVDSTWDSVFDENGFFRTGDLGSVDGGGNLRIIGRLKDIIIRKGENISPREVEELLAEHADVDDVAVVGLPDPASGERCCAVLVASDPDRPPELPALVGFLLGRGLTKQKLPEQLEVVAALPKNSSGKVMKHVLQAKLAGADGQP